MTHALSKEQKLLKNSIAKIAEEKISPLAEETDREAKFPWHTVKLLKRYDMFAVDFPEEYDGAGMGLFSACLNELQHGHLGRGILHGDPVREKLYLILSTGQDLPPTFFSLMEK